MLVSLAIVIILPQPHGIRAFIASTILRLIFSVGLEPTLYLLGAFNVSAGQWMVGVERVGVGQMVYGCLPVYLSVCHTLLWPCYNPAKTLL